MTIKKLKSRITYFSHEGLEGKDLEAAAVPKLSKKPNKKCTSSLTDHVEEETLVENDADHGEQINSGQMEDNLNEPTMGDKFGSLNLHDNTEIKSHERVEYSQLKKPPRADSVHVLLKQALHTNDQALILNCLLTQDEKVITNSISLLNTSDVLVLLDSLITLTQSRGAVLASALPWLRSLLIQHASGIISQDSSLLALNSLYQLIESRVSTFNVALQLSSCLDLSYKGTLDDGLDEIKSITPIVYEDNDESEGEESEDNDKSEEEESEDAMETDQESSDPEPLYDSFDNYKSEEMSL